MKNYLTSGIVGGVCLAIAMILLLVFSPDWITIVFVGLMSLLTIYGYINGILKIRTLGLGFKEGIKNIEKAREVSTTYTWLALKEKENLFGNSALDEAFDRFKERINVIDDVDAEKICALEEYIDEEYLENIGRRNLISLIPNTLTGMGILGTFIGLIMGISNIAVSSVTATVSSIETVISGIYTAFYTSIGGVILSLIFNYTLATVWNNLITEKDAFFYEFHRYIFPSAEEQLKIDRLNLNRKIENICDRISEYLDKVK